MDCLAAQLPSVLLGNTSDEMSLFSILLSDTFILTQKQWLSINATGKSVYKVPFGKYNHTTCLFKWFWIKSGERTGKYDCIVVLIKVGSRTFSGLLGLSGCLPFLSAYRCTYIITRNHLRKVSETILLNVWISAQLRFFHYHVQRFF